MSGARIETRSRHPWFSLNRLVGWCIVFGGLHVYLVVSSRSQVKSPSANASSEPQVIPWYTAEQEKHQDLGFLKQWKGYRSFGREGGVVKYVQAEAEIQVRAQMRQCSRLLKVLAWLAHHAEKLEEPLMITYGALLHYHRENTIWNNSTGDYLDDDFDIWALPGAVKQILKQERKLFNMFGWTMRVYLKHNYVVLIQVICSCGHKPEARASKATADEPAIEIYPLVHTPTSVGNLVFDTWQGNKIDLSLLVPVRDTVLNEVNIKIPKRSLEILTCLYGKWRAPSPEHDSGLKVCVEKSKKHLMSTS